MPDGSVKIPVGLNFDTAIKDAKQLGNELKHILSNIDMSKLDAKTLSFIKNLTNVTNRMEKLAGEAQKLADTRIPTERYEALTKLLDQTKKRMEEIEAERKKLLNKGEKYGSEYKELGEELERLKKRYERVSGNIAQMQELGQDTVSGTTTQEYKNKVASLMQAVQAANILKEKYAETHMGAEQVIDDEEKLDLTLGEEIQLAQEATKEEESHKLSLASLGKASKVTASAMAGLTRTLLRMINPLSLLSRHSRSSSRHTDDLGKSMKRGLMTLLKYTLGIRSLYFLFRRLRSVAKEAIKVMVQEIPEMNKAVSDIVTAFKGLKASVGTLVQPFIQAFAPAITLAIQKVTELMNKMAQLFAMLAGQNYIYEASVDYVDYAKSVEEASGSLAGFDKLNVISQQKNGVGLTKDTVHYAKKYFDTVSLADNTLVKTLKTTLKLIKDIGASFKKAWENGAGETILSNIQRWLDGILLTIQNITINFDKAWNTAGIGDSIAETLLGLFSDLSGFIADISEDTAAWAETLDFTPILESAQNLLAKFREFLQPIYAILEDIWNEILLPLGKWLIEKLGPALGDLASTVLDKITKFLEWLEPKLKWLMENVIRPIAGAIGDAFIGLIKHVQELLDGPLSDTMKDLADFYESDIKPILEYVFGFLAVLLPKAINTFSNLAKTTLTTLSNLVGDVKDVLKGVIEFVTGVFTLDLDKALQGIKDIFKGIFNGILSIIEGLINGLIDVINFVGSIVGFELEHVHIRRWGEDSGKMPDANASQEAKDAWNKKMDSLEEFIEDFSGFDNELANKLGAGAINKLKGKKLPRLAEGAVLPPNKPFLAMVGDQTKGTNIEAPLSTIEQAVANVMAKMGVKVTFDVKGDPKGLFKVWQKEAKVYSMQFPNESLV